MRKVLNLTLILLMLACFTPVLQAQTPSFSRNHIYGANSNSPCYDVEASGSYYYFLRITVTGTVSAGTVKLVGYNNVCASGGTDIIAATAATASGRTDTFSGPYKYVRLEPASFSGSGLVSVQLNGWVFDPSPLFVYNSTKPTVTNGQRVDLQPSSRGELTTLVCDAAANARCANVNASNQLSTAVDALPSALVLATQADDLANTSDGFQGTSFGYVFDGSTWDRARGDSTNGTLVNLGSNNDVVVSNISDDDAHDSPVTQDPVLTGCYASSTAPTAVSTNGDAARCWSFMNGQQAVTLVDSGGTPVAVGGGTQYTEGDTDASITGTALMIEGAGNTLVAAPGTAAGGLLVDLGGNNDVTITSISAGTNYVGKVRLTDGTDDGDILDLTNSNPVVVALVDANGDQIISFGGGVQYTETDTDASITGTVLMWEDTSDTIRAVSAAKPLPINVVAGITVDSADNDPFTEAPVGVGCLYDTTPDDHATGDKATLQCDIKGNQIVVGTGTFAVQVTGSLLTSSELLDDTVFTLGTGTYSEATSKGNLIGAVRKDAAGTLCGTDNEICPFQLNANGQLRVDASAVAIPVTDNSGSITVDAPVGTPVFTTPTPSATGGWTAFNATAADAATACTSTAQAVKGSQGTFGGFDVTNPNTADAWLHVYNIASGSVTVGTSTPTYTKRIPGNSVGSVGANMEITLGIQFSTAISIACTSTAGGNGAPSTALEVMVFYK